jgi:hypothetical protein
MPRPTSTELPDDIPDALSIGTYERVRDSEKIPTRVAKNL